MKRPDPNASDGKNGARPKPKPKPKAKVASEKEQEVAEALFDLANLAALAGGDEPSGPAKRKRARGKKDAGDDGGDGAKAAKRETENFGDAVPGTVPAGVPGGFPGAAANPLQALFSNPTAMSAMASHLYGAPGAAAAMGAGFGGIPGFDIQSMAAALRQTAQCLTRVRIEAVASERAAASSCSTSLLCCREVRRPSWS